MFVVRSCYNLGADEIDIIRSSKMPMVSSEFCPFKASSK